MKKLFIVSTIVLLSACQTETKKTETNETKVEVSDNPFEQE